MSLDMYGEKIAEASALIREFAKTDYYHFLQGNPETALEAFIAMLDQAEEKGRQIEREAQDKRFRELGDSAVALNNMHVAEQEAQAARITELERENARLDAALDEEISTRDHYHEWADRLAAEIARYFGVDIGEHSNANNPWEQAYEAVPAVPSAPAVVQPIGHISKGMLEQLHERLGVSGYVQSGHTEEFPVAIYTAPQATDTDKVREALPYNKSLIFNMSRRFAVVSAFGDQSEPERFVFDSNSLMRYVEEIGSFLVAQRDCNMDMAAQAPVREVPGWQPIETAPKNGTEIVVRYPLQGNVKRVAHYDIIHKFWVSNGEPFWPVENQCEWCSLPTDFPAAPVLQEGESNG